MRYDSLWRGVILAMLVCVVSAGAAMAETFDFDADWRFSKGDPADAASPDFDDSQWRQLDLPHDWAIEGPFSNEYNARCGGLPFHGTAWYRKTFDAPADWKDKYVAVIFDGAMANAEVFLNGARVAERPYGYIGFEANLTPALREGENVLAVRLAPEDLSSRWYPGAGLYRHVHLRVTEPVHVKQWGVYITTPEVTDEEAIVHVETEIENAALPSEDLTLETSLFDMNGRPVSQHIAPFTTSPRDTVSATTLEQNIVLQFPRRWDITNPHLYTAVVKIKDADGQVLDQTKTRFGIRTIDYSVDKGFVLNGRPVKFQGVCLHHDLGPLGAAVNRRATQRQLEIMKAMGVNAIRTAHNPPSPEQLELCDEMGILVQDEAFDVWRTGKVENGYNKYFDEWSERDLRGMIRRDRNHPSVVMWSIGNEIREQNQKDGYLVGRRLVEICHDEDPTRPVTAGFNSYPGCFKNGLAFEVDLVGLNYKPAFYAEAQEQNPEKIIYGSETASTVSTRGVYHLPIEAYTTHESKQVSSYDFIAPPWAYAPDIEFHFQERHPNNLGEFIWTGFDYLGEPTPYGGRDNSTNGYWNDDWPAHGSYFGAVDLCGFRKDRFYLYQSQWTDRPMVHILPHWNWAGHEGETIPVMVYTNCDEAEVFLNGTSLGRQRKGEHPVTIPVEFKGYEPKTFDSPYRMKWNVAYQPGELKVVAYKDGQAICEEAIVTAGAPAKLRLVPDRTVIDTDGDDLSFVTVRVEDEKGNFCPLADNLLQFQVEGAGELEAVGSGNPISIEPFQADRRKAFNGLGMLIVRSNGKSGDIRVTVSSEDLQGAETVLTASSSGTVER